MYCCRSPPEIISSAPSRARTLLARGPTPIPIPRTGPRQQLFRLFTPRRPVSLCAVLLNNLWQGAMSRARKEESQHALLFFFLLSSLTTPRRVPFVSRRCSSGRMVAPNPRGSCRYARTHVDLSTSPVQPISNSSSVTSLCVLHMVAQTVPTSGLTSASCRTEIAGRMHGAQPGDAPSVMATWIQSDVRPPGQAPVPCRRSCLPLSLSLSLRYGW